MHIKLKSMFEGDKCYGVGEARKGDVKWQWWGD